MWLTGPAAPRHVGSSQTRARTRVPCIGRQILNHCATREALGALDSSFPHPTCPDHQLVTSVPPPQTYLSWSTFPFTSALVWPPSSCPAGFLSSLFYSLCSLALPPPNWAKNPSVSSHPQNKKLLPLIYRGLPVHALTSQLILLWFFPLAH